MKGKAIRQADYEFWSSVLPALDEDSDTACMRLGLKTGKAAGAVARIIMGIYRLKVKRPGFSSASFTALC